MSYFLFAQSTIPSAPRCYPPIYSNALAPASTTDSMHCEDIEGEGGEEANNSTETGYELIVRILASAQASRVVYAIEEVFGRGKGSYMGIWTKI